MTDIFLLVHLSAPEFRLNWRQQINIGLILSVPLFVIAALVTVIMFVIFTVFGLFAIDETLTSDWITPASGAREEPNVWYSFSLLGQQYSVSEELVRVSIFVASVAALSFTNTAVRDPELREKLVTPKCEHLRHLVAAWVFYRNATRKENDG